MAAHGSDPLSPCHESQPSERDKVAFLSSQAPYPEITGEVEVHETHMAWVFLVDDRAYKLKKPLAYGHGDGRSLTMREFLCREEVRLNRRLAPDVYLGVVPLGLDLAGNLVLRGSERVVDWLVVMRRLPEPLLLDVALKKESVLPADIDRVADRLIDFYRGLEPEPISPDAYLDHFAREHASNREVLEDERLSLPRERVKAVLSRLDHLIEEVPDLLGDRARQGRIVEGHGDLRPEHVCLSRPPVIIDCLEFSHVLRQVDPFDELSFLGMECDRLGAGWIGRQLLERCTRALHDSPDPRLLAFYTAYRACLRARLTLLHLLEPDPCKPEKWQARAWEYLALAERACVGPELKPLRQ